MMCDYWKDYGYDDGGERCQLTGQRTLCEAKQKYCKCKEILKKQKKFSSKADIGLIVFVVILINFIALVYINA